MSPCIQYHTTHGTYKRDVQLVRACMHDPMNIQGKHTGCSWCVYLECCATLVQCRLPTCFSGRYHWKSLALVQRPVAFPASYWTLFQGLVISKDTRCLLQHIPPMVKQIPCQAACFSSQMRLSSASHLSDGWQESVFPTASAVQTVGEVVEDAPEHLNQNDDKNTQCLKTVCKTSPVNRLF